MEQEARETRAFRMPPARAETAGLASLSNAALLKRLRNVMPWLDRLVARQLIASGSGLCVPAAAQSRLKEPI
jgi:hypothetical protein